MPTPSLSLSRLARHAANTAWRGVDWAHAQLQPHAGKTLRVEIWPLAAGFSLRVTSGGEWEDSLPDAAPPPDATLRLTPSLLPRLAFAPDKPSAALQLDGDPAFIRTLRDLQDVLPLAFEERLSSLIGPILAHGISTAVRGLAAWPAHATDRVGAGVAAYLTEESRTLVARNAFADFADEIQALDARVDRLAERS